MTAKVWISEKEKYRVTYLQCYKAIAGDIASYVAIIANYFHLFLHTCTAETDFLS